MTSSLPNISSHDKEVTATKPKSSILKNKTI